jgi:8-oxo-dGTP diphosphatase
MRLLGQHVFAPADDWTYTTVVVGVDEPFGRSKNFETDAVDWTALDDVARRPLHPGFASAWPHLRAIVRDRAAVPASERRTVSYQSER